MSLQQFFNVLISSSLFILVALSFTLTYYITRFFHITHAIIITLGAYFTYLLSLQFKLSLWFAIPVAISSSVLIGLLIESFIYEPLRKKGTSHLSLLIASLGLYIVLQNFISLLWGDDMKSLNFGEIKVGYDINGAFVTNSQLSTIIVSLVFFIITLLFLKYHKIGKKIRAVSANEELSNIQGIDSSIIILWSIGIGSGLASVAGILVASDTGLTPTMGFNLLLYGIVAMIIGGVGSIRGLIGGAFLLAISQQFTAYYIDSKWVDAVTYLVLILFLIWKPLGFSGNRLKKIEI